MRLALNLFAVVAYLILGVQAAIVSIAPFTATYNATAKSTISITFGTAPTFDVHEDYGAMLGVGTALSNSRIGTLFGRLDLVALGYTTYAGSNFTISNIPLPKSSFPAAGNYTLAVGLMYSNGAARAIGSNVYYAPLKVVF